MLKKSSLGLDISDNSIKFVELINTKDGMRVGRYGEREIPKGVIEMGEVKQPKKLEEILRSLKKEFGLKSVRLSMSRGDGENIKKHLSVFKNSAIAVKSFESKVDAVCRAILKTGDKDTHMIINLGEDESTIFVVIGGNAVFGSNTSANNAEVLREEAAKNFLRWHTKKEEEENRLPIKRIILCGASPNLVEFSEYLAVGLRHKVDVANVWINIRDIEEYIPEITFRESPAFAPALGLALSDFL